LLSRLRLHSNLHSRGVRQFASDNMQEARYQF